MCVIEVKKGMHHPTVAQAMAHNTSTVERDMDFLRVYLMARGDTQSLEEIDRASMHLHAAYTILLAHWKCIMADCTDDAVYEGPGIQPTERPSYSPFSPHTDDIDLAMGYQ